MLCHHSLGKTLQSPQWTQLYLSVQAQATRPRDWNILSRLILAKPDYAPAWWATWLECRLNLAFLQPPSPPYLSHKKSPILFKGRGCCRHANFTLLLPTWKKFFRNNNYEFRLTALLTFTNPRHSNIEAYLTYKTTPTDHISSDLLYPLFSRTSGAR